MAQHFRRHGSCNESLPQFLGSLLIRGLNQLRHVTSLLVTIAFLGLLLSQTTNSKPTSGAASQSSRVTGNVARRSPDTSNVQYASGSGSDLNDGVSWTTAKLTLLGACESLPGGSTAPPSCGEGTIYFTDGAYAQANHTCGLWLMGATDINYRRPPACWIKIETVGGFSLHIVGVATANHGPNPHQGRAILGGGSGADINHPTIWISGSNSPLWFENIAIQYPGRGIVISQDSNGVYSGCNHAGSTGIRFDNVTVNLNSIVGNGPAWDIGGCTFWLWILHSGASGLDSVNTSTADNAAAILFRASTDGQSMGLSYLEDLNLSGGGIKIHTARNSLNSLVVKNVTTEGQHGPAAIWFVDGNPLGQYHFEDIQVADPMGRSCNGTVCAVENDVPGMNPESVVVVGSASLKGSMTLQGATNPYNLTGGVGPAQGSGLSIIGSGVPFVNGQEGFVNGYIYANTDAARRLFGPTAVPFANQANTNPSNWILPNGVTLTTGVTAPDKTSGAGRTTYSGSSGSNGPYFYSVPGGTPVTVSAGDWFIAGVWSRLNSGSAWDGNSQGAISIGGCVVTFSGTPSISGAPYDGNWVWGATVIKILTVSHNPCLISFTGRNGAKNADQTDYYAPIFFRIPARTIPDTEVQMIYHNLESYDSSCPVGTNCGLRGQTLVEDHYGTLANCGSSSSAAVCGSAAAGSVVVAAGATSVLVKTSAVTANSQIILTFDSSLGKRLGVTCNTTFDQGYVTARTPGVGFTITASAPTTNPACFSYQILN
jgi:hypothetical protein